MSYVEVPSSKEEFKAARISCAKEVEIQSGAASWVATFDPKRADGATVDVHFHIGMKSFVINDGREYLSKSYVFKGLLHECVDRFEKMFEVKLPPIKVFEVGVGVWEAHSKYATTDENPWKLHPGDFCSVLDRYGYKSFYSVNDRGNLVSRTENGSAKGVSSEDFEPRIIFGRGELLSLQKLDSPSLRERQRG